MKDSAAAGIVQDELRDALARTGFTVGDSPVHAHIVLEEFSSGSTAKRVLFDGSKGAISLQCPEWEAELPNSSMQTTGLPPATESCYRPEP